MTNWDRDNYNTEEDWLIATKYNNDIVKYQEDLEREKYEQMADDIERMSSDPSYQLHLVRKTAKKYPKHFNCNLELKSAYYGDGPRYSLRCRDHGLHIQWLSDIDHATFKKIGL